MTITVETGHGGFCKLIAAGNMTIYEAAADKQLLLDALDGAKELCVDLSALERIDSAGLQLLVLLKREAQRAKKILRLIAHSPASLEIVDGYNVISYFGDPAAVPSR